MKFINLTPHAINVAGVVYPASGETARVAVSHVEGTPVDGVRTFTQVYGDVQGIPAPVDGVMYIVSAMVFAATDRADVVAPATGHDEIVRNEKGHIVSVPGFITK